GRDTATLDGAGVARAAVESLAENFSDGIVAPVFWLVVAGLPGIALYKAINTADSMIGHRTPRYADFGWAAARLDDLVHLPASPPCRLGGSPPCCCLPPRFCGKMPPQARRGVRSGAMPPAIVRLMPAIRKRQWPARSDCRSPDRASMAVFASRTRSWATAAVRP